MPYYTCRLAGEDGRLLSRSVLAPSPGDCRKLFEAEGYGVLSVTRDWRKLRIDVTVFGKKIRDRDFILFNQELMALIKSGYPILKSIETIAGRMKNVHLKELLQKVEADIRAGKSLSESFQPFESQFSTVYLASLMAGEKSGNLPGTIGRYVEYARTIARTKSRIRSALVYPTLLISFSLILMSILMTFILPRFATFYQGFQAEMPWITRALISVALGFRKYVLLILLVAVLLVLVFIRNRRKEDFRVALDRLKLRLPIGGIIWWESGISLFSRTLGLLLEAGISLLSAVGIACQAVPNMYILKNMRGLQDSIKNGQGLTDSLAGTGVFPGMALDMVRIGETSANLQGMLGDVADFYDERIRAKIDTLVSLIEPVVIIFMALIVAGMLLSVYLPIFNIIRIVR
jgi:type IV pilus assembly protein PilC